MTAVYIAALLPLFALSAFFSASETVLLSLSPAQIARIGSAHPRVGRWITAWMKAPSHVLSAILAGNTLVNFAIASLGYLLLLRIMPDYAAAVSVPICTLLLLFFGEIGPKQYALARAEKLAPFCARALRISMIVLAPFSALMIAGSRLFQDKLSRERRALSDEELRAVVKAAAFSGEITAKEATLILETIQ